MRKPPRPSNESERLQSLLDFSILDSSPEADFDDITRLASEICETPMAVISFVDGERQWFKSKVGVDAEETSRDIAFCAYAIMDDKVMVVPDATQDPRFRDNPFVTEEPKIRFYAGAPICTPDGKALGTLCVMDSRSREFTQRQLDALAHLSRQVMRLLRIRKVLEREKAFGLDLLSSNERLTNLIESNPFGIMALDRNFRITDWNSACEKIFGWSRSEVLGGELPFVTPEMQADLKNRIDEVRNSKGPHNFTSHRKRKNGDEVIVDISVIPLFDEQKNRNGMLAVLRDVTADHRLKKELDESHLKLKEAMRSLKLITDNIPALIAYWGTDERCLFANKQHFEWYGYDSSEIVSMKLEAFLGPAIYEASRKYVHGVLAGEPQYFERESQKLASGDLRHTQVHYLPDFYEGKVRGFFVLVTDVTNLKAAEKRALEEKQKALAATNAKSEFLANMSHEIRTPMNGVVGMTELLLETELNGEQRNYVESIKSSSSALLTIINDILDFSKIEAGKIEIEKTDFDLQKMISELDRVFFELARAKGLRFTTRAEVLRHPAFVGDPGRIRQVMTNLVGNAVKFTEKGSVEVRLEVLSETLNDSRIRIAVVDSGSGIAPESQSKLFQSFSQADTSITRRYGGTGLGLSISKKIVELMGGKIGFESRLGGGSTFWFELDLAKSGVHIEPDVVTTAAVQAMHERDFRVLVAEDNPTNQKIIVIFLEKLGFSVDVVGNGHLALEALSKTTYDVVLMDCQMPEMDGYEATRTIRASKENFASIPIIALTANALKGDRERCLDAGMDDYLSKPFTKTEIQTVMSKWAAIASCGHQALHKHEESVFDGESLSRLKELGGGSSDFVQTIGNLLFDSLPSEIAEIKSALNLGDCERIAAVTHKIIPGCKSFGVTALVDLLQDLESQAKARELSDSMSLLARIENELRKAKDEFDRTLKRAA